jgi:nicotinamidase-related amidase
MFVSMRRLGAAAILGIWATGGCAAPAEGGGGVLTLRLRSGESVREVRWEARETAFVVCDMWDGHWCRGAARRVAEMAPVLNETLREARKRGAFILHAPSSTVKFYDGTPARERARRAPLARTPVAISTATRWGTGWCWPDPAREPELPIDDSDMGCDCTPSCAVREAWTRQIASIEIDPERDALTDDAQEAYNLFEERGIRNVVLLGVHLNMCVLGRPVGIRQMTYLGKNVALVRDLTDTMYNSRKKPFVSHHAGTDLVVAHVEKHWCPTFTSADLAGGKPFRFSDDRR